MTKIIHPVAGALALATLLFFWLSTVASEIFGDMVEVQQTKHMILWGLTILVPLLAIAGGSGQFLARGSRSPAIARKRTIMKYAALNGLVVLVPCAFVLDRLAQAEDFGIVFGIVQAVEILAGATNAILLSINMKAGLTLAGRLKSRRAGAA